MVKEAKSIPFEIRALATVVMVVLFGVFSLNPLTTAEGFCLYLMGYTSLTLFDFIVALRSTRIER